MSKQNETKPATEQTTDCYDAALHELKCLEAGLNLDKASEQTRFFLGLLKERLEQKTNIRYHDVINQLCSFFDDSDFTYTKILETMNDAQIEVARIRDMACEHADHKESVPMDFMLENVTSFFWKMHLLLWNLKPIAIDQERHLQDMGSRHVGYSVSQP